MNETQIGYLAGIIDGEGCIYVNRRNPHGRRKTYGYGVKVCVNITSYALVDWLICHAQLTSIHHKPHPKGNRKEQWLCTWNNSKAEWLLNSVFEHLVIKTEQAKLGLQLLHHLRETPVIRGKCVSEENIKFRESIKKQISKLNTRGRPVGGE